MALGKKCVDGSQTYLGEKPSTSGNNGAQLSLAAELKADEF